jgi:eukaryotic-like serine/threonine-protein kinase
MTPERYRQIDGVFQKAAEFAPADRAGFLDAACRGDEELRREVESLLEHDAPDTRLERSIRDMSKSMVSDREPERLGPYRVTGVIGRGGMGVVYAAVRDDDSYRKQVAVKLVKRGMDTDFVLTRFKSERRILARLEHPNIAQLLDGGSADDGRPYFVMEHVQGEPITTYCEKRELPVPARLRLFLAVCSAVQHAHQNMVVHRDLKPSNVLVTGDGAVKLLDFGIAKVLQGGDDDSDEQTVAGLRMMTPGYASPEQALGQPVTTASDVYSLGAVLYELLARQPLSAADSKVKAKALTGDLGNIVSMALRKEPERRYATADQLAADLRRALEHRPVQARPDTFGYRARKFIRRNRIGLAAVVMLSVSLVGGTAVSMWQARRAERRFELVRKLAGALIYDVHDEIRDLAGSTRARQKIVATGLEYLSALEREAAGDPNLQRDLASAYLRIGDVQGGVFSANLGDTKGALASYRKARGLLAGMRVTPESTLQVATTEAKIAEVLMYHGDLTGSLETFRQAQKLVEPLTAVEARQRLASTLQGIARVQGLQRDMDAAHATAMKVLEIRRALSENEKTADAQSALADAEAEVSMSLQRRGRAKEALPHARKALEIRQEQAARDQNNASAQRGLILSYSHVADVLGNPTMPSLGDTAGAIAMYREMTAVAERVAAADALDRRAKYDLANCLLRLGSALTAADGAEEGVWLLERSASLMEEIAQTEPKNNRPRLALAFLHVRIGDGLRTMGRARASLDRYQRAIGVATAMIAAAPDERVMALNLANAHNGRGLALAALGDGAGAAQSGLRGAQVLEQAQREQPANLRTLINLAEGYTVVAQIHRKIGDNQVCSWLAKAQATYLEKQQREPLAAPDAAKFESLKRDLVACAGR